MNSNLLSTPGLADPTATMGLALDRLKTKAASSENSTGDKRLKELKDTAQQFEALFTSYLLKVMRSTVDEDEEAESNSFGKSVYQEMFDNEIAMSISRSQGLGLADMIYRQLSEQMDQETHSKGKTDPAAAEPAAFPSVLPPAGSTQPVIPAASPAAPAVERISSPYGLRVDPLDDKVRFHHGVDIAAPAGTPIKAAQAGRVVFSGLLGGYGNVVILEHETGMRTLYGHASRNLVSAGEQVSEGDVLGLVGSTGRSTGPHLHFEVQKNGEPLNPALMMAGNMLALVR
jgi:murein DD-endopeptidase MepM/ murein hydrolase activator NlpD